MKFYKDAKVLVTGGTGMIGRFLVQLLIEEGAKVRVVSLDGPSRSHPEAEFRRVDLTRFENCVEACKDREYVFHLAGVKGSPLMTLKKPASFFVPTITFNTHMMEAARSAGVERYLYTSSIGVYGPAERFNEDDVWKTFPSENDRFAGWAKRMGELQAEAYKIEYGWDKITIVRPANVYGPYDNFDPANAMVIPSLIQRAMSGENPLVVWGDGSPVRDFIHAKDVANGMFLTMQKAPGCWPINLGSGTGISIRKVVDIIVGHLKTPSEVIWDSTKPSGDQIRLMDISRARSLGFEPTIPVEKGIPEVMDWYEVHQHEINGRYNVFTI